MADNTALGSKLCSRCKDRRPLESFTRSQKSPDGRGYYCSSCRRQYRSENPTKRSPPTDIDRERSRQRSAAWRQKRRDHIATYKLEYRSKNAEEISAYDRAYRAQHADRLLEEARARAKRWREGNPSKVRIKNDRRRALKMSAFVEDVDVDIVYEAESGACFVCGEGIDRELKFPHPRSLTLEHIVPLARGGTHSYANSSVSHYRCNASKGARI